MSKKERKKYVVMIQILQKHMALKEAAKVLNLSYRQIKRVWKRYKYNGARGSSIKAAVVNRIEKHHLK